MTDLEITKLCAKAMGGEGFAYDEFGPLYDPLHDDAQAMALVKKLRLIVSGALTDLWYAEYITRTPEEKFFRGTSTDLNRAICECVAKLQKEKHK